MDIAHVGLVEFIITGCYVLIFSFLWRTLAGLLHEHPVGQSMAAVFS